MNNRNWIGLKLNPEHTIRIIHSARSWGKRFYMLPHLIGQYHQVIAGNNWSMPKEKYDKLIIVKPITSPNVIDMIRSIRSL